MREEILINLQNERFSGNILDIGFYNHGIVYNIYKLNNKDFKIEYINGNDSISNVEESCYDSCVMFLSFSSIMFKIRRKALLEEINKYLKVDGYIYIWDIEKSYGKIFDNKIKVLMPHRKIKELYIKDYNIFKETSQKSTLELFRIYFDIIYSKSLNNIYCIKAQKKRRRENESDFGSS
ncbi:class I SAM-dependent methyltransferase [Clostridium ganghwense]|uniref:Class I SAM-dependent methyltransferase n=1 Tax=Clostridium ganghwense TaxID=312089 RepID=A0ABT4CP74_9CLOT|nr:class I SAM-dependent methyltransferase [Clostridium ganghwense]MCY6370847.1 class I SAM-dependent methyltransferase [Clostridium ganghwense]